MKYQFSFQTPREFFRAVEESNKKYDGDIPIPNMVFISAREHSETKEKVGILSSFTMSYIDTEGYFYTFEKEFFRFSGGNYNEDGIIVKLCPELEEIYLRDFKFEYEILSQKTKVHMSFSKMFHEIITGKRMVIRVEPDNTLIREFEAKMLNAYKKFSDDYLAKITY